MNSYLYTTDMTNKVSFVYILRCADDSYYTGVTTDIKKRLHEHVSGEHPKSYTYSRRPVKLVFYASFMDIRQAIEKEKQIKRWSRSKKEALINGEYDALPNLAKKKF